MARFRRDIAFIGMTASRQPTELVIPVTMQTAPYTGTGVSITYSGTNYDVNISTDGATAPDGAFIIKQI